jgi:hypothetical protein
MIWRKSPGNKKYFWHGLGRVVGKQTDKVWIMYGSKVYRCAPEQVRHVEHDVIELSWLPHDLKKWKSTIREKGAGNVVELDKGRFPPENERTHSTCWVELI